MDRERPSPNELVALLGPHPARSLGLDLDAGNGAESDLSSWLVASVLLGGRTPEAVALDAFRRLRDARLATPAEIATAGAPALLAPLEAAKIPKCEGVAAVIGRVSSNLERQHSGSVDRLAAGADDLEDLAHRLSGLGAGFGRAAVLRFLTPLRERWSAANDLPATTAVCSAASDLGLLAFAEDAEGAPATIAAWTRNETGPDDVGPAAAAPRDVEAALERLGRRACLRGRSERCPLGERCPRTGAGSEIDA